MHALSMGPSQFVGAYPGKAPQHGACASCHQPGCPRGHPGARLNVTSESLDWKKQHHRFTSQGSLDGGFPTVVRVRSGEQISYLLL